MTTADSADRPLAAAAGEVLQLGIHAAAAFGRDDLVERLTASRERLDDPDIAVMVVGEFKQGKSTLVNALLNVSACPVDDDIATAVPTTVRYGNEASATAVFEPQPSEDPDQESVPEREPIGFDDVPAYVTQATGAGGRSLRSVELTLPRKLLASGLAMIDTPGVGGLTSEHGAVTMGALPAAEAVLFVTDASQELTRPELDFLRRACELCPHVAVVLTKIDLYATWRRIADLDRQHLVAAGVEVPVLAVSSLIRRRAIDREDSALNAESGYPDLLAWLRDDVLARADQIAASAAGRDVVGVCEQLRVHFDAERQVLSDPERAAALVEQLAQAQARAEHLKSGAARWQTTLNDGVQDLNADVDHDLRGRFREINVDADARLESADPIDVWDEFEPWLRHYVAAEVAANHAYLVQCAGELSQRIAGLFAEDELAIGVDAAIANPIRALEEVTVAAELDTTSKSGVVSSALGVLRGGYGGMMMFGMLAGMAGITLVAPVTLAIGLAMGKKQQREERTRQLTQRRQQAKQAYRKYVDAVTFSVSKESRDALRRVHRELRDSWTTRAQELQRTTQEALQAAQQGATVGSAARDRRLADIDAELARIDTLKARAARLMDER